jgi:hypothetical protein
MNEAIKASEQEVYLEPSVELDREIVDPLGLDETEPKNNNVCPPGGC